MAELVVRAGEARPRAAFGGADFRARGSAHQAPVGVRAARPAVHVHRDVAVVAGLGGIADRVLDALAHRHGVGQAHPPRLFARGVDGEGRLAVPGHAGIGGLRVPSAAPVEPPAAGDQIPASCRQRLVEDEEHEVVAEEAAWILHLQQAHSGRRRQACEFDDDGVVFAVRQFASLAAHRAGHAPTVHQQMGAGLDVFAAQAHRRVVVELREVRRAAAWELRQDGQLVGAQGRLRMRVVGVRAEPRGDGEQRFAGCRELHERGARECGIAVAFAVFAAAVFERQCAGRTVRRQEQTIAVQHHAAFVGGLFQRIEQRRGRLQPCAAPVQRRLPAEGAGEAHAAFQDHLEHVAVAREAEALREPSGVAAHVVGEEEAVLRGVLPAVVGAAPGRHVHAAAAHVRHGPEGHAMAVAALLLELELANAGRRLGGDGVGVRALRRRRIGHAQEVLGQRRALAAREQAGPAFVVGLAVALLAHGGGEGAFQHVQGAGLFHFAVAVRFHQLVDVGRVHAAVGIARDAVPVVGGAAAQTAHVLRQPWLDLLAAGVAQRRVEHPQQLVGVAVRVAAGAGEGAGAGGVGVVEGDAPAPKIGLHRIGQRDGVLHERLGGIGEIHPRHAVGERVQDPGSGRRPGAVALQGDAARDRAHVDTAEHRARVGIHGEQPARCRRRRHQRRVVAAHGNGERRGQRQVLGRMLGRRGFQLEPRRLAAAFGAIEGRDLVEEGAVLHLGQTVAEGAGLAVGVVARLRLGDEHLGAGIHRDAVEQGTEGVHDFHKRVRGGVEDVQVAVRDVRMAHDVRHVAGGEALRRAAHRFGDVFAGVEGT